MTPDTLITTVDEKDARKKRRRERRNRDKIPKIGYSYCSFQIQEVSTEEKDDLLELQNQKSN